MEDSILLYVLLFPTFLNTLLLIALVVILYRTSTIIANLSVKIETFLERGKEEIFSTTEAIRNAAQHGGRFLEKAADLADKAVSAYSLKQPLTTNPRLSRLAKGIGVGFNIYKIVSNFLKQRNKS